MGSFAHLIGVPRIREDVLRERAQARVKLCVQVNDVLPGARAGASTWDEGLLLFLERSGFPEETYHTFSYGPVYDDGGRIAGMPRQIEKIRPRRATTRRH
jgi:hypothetical protein